MDWCAARLAKKRSVPLRGRSRITTRHAGVGDARTPHTRARTKQFAANASIFAPAREATHAPTLPMCARIDQIRPRLNHHTAAGGASRRSGICRSMARPRAVGGTGDPMIDLNRYFDETRRDLSSVPGRRRTTDPQAHLATYGRNRAASASSAPGSPRSCARSSAARAPATSPRASSTRPRLNAPPPWPR